MQVDRAIGPFLAPKLWIGTGVEIKLDGVTIKDRFRAARIGHFCIKSPKADIKRLGIPKVKELAGSLIDVAVVVVHRGAKRLVPLVQIPVNRHRFISLDDQSTNIGS